MMNRRTIRLERKKVRLSAALDRVEHDLRYAHRHDPVEVLLPDETEIVSVTVPDTILWLPTAVEGVAYGTTGLDDTVIRRPSLAWAEAYRGRPLDQSPAVPLDADEYDDDADIDGSDRA